MFQPCFPTERERHSSAALLAAALLVLTAGSRGSADLVPILHETFDTDPVSAGRATLAGPDPGAASRFSAAGGMLVAAYDTGRPTAQLRFPLDRTLDETTDFRFTVDFTLVDNQRFYADPYGFAQLAFGLIHRDRTGFDRAGGPLDLVDDGDAFNVVGVDYFANISPEFGGPSLVPTVVTADRGAGYFASVLFPFGKETDLSREGPLPRGTPLHLAVDYDAAGRVLTLAMPGRNINADGQGGPGGPDGDASTIQNLLPADVRFSVDTFAISLWEDTWRFPADHPSLVADVAFDRFTVFAVPEPGALPVLLGALWPGRRRSRRAVQSPLAR